MAEPIDETNAGKYLTAFADGELDIEQSMAVFQYMCANPESALRVFGQQQLRRTLARVARNQTPPPSDALRKSIDQLAASTSLPDSDPLLPADRASLMHGRRKLIAAAAGFLIVGLALGYFLTPLRDGRVATGPNPPTTPTTATSLNPAPPVPVTLVEAITRIHVDCSRALDRLHSAKEYPGPLADLSASVKRDLGRSRPYPDLSSMGYRFVGTGPCDKPIEGTAHLLYRADATRAQETVSLFVQPNKGQFSIEPGKIYAAATPDSVHPMLVWRTQEAVYFLVGDAAETVQAASKLSQPASRI